tara:strand:- start:2154 stop:2636 length:483 start_codon:yes stop_codon:yes gene_type:complete
MKRQSKNTKTINIFKNIILNNSFDIKWEKVELAEYYIDQEGLENHRDMVIYQLLKQKSNTKDKNGLKLTEIMNRVTKLLIDEKGLILMAQRPRTSEKAITRFQPKINSWKVYDKDNPEDYKLLDNHVCYSEDQRQIHQTKIERISIATGIEYKEYKKLNK